MSKQYNKVFEYKGRKFNIQVVLDSKVEKKLDGDVWHEVTVNDMGFSNYYNRELILSDDLPRYIKARIEDIKLFVDKPLNVSKTEQILLDLGFETF